MRFIPTGVGNRKKMSDKARQIAVHPHGRGEQVCYRNARTGGGGSSPRAWGTALDLICWRSSSRFIPTGVGNSRHRHRPGHDDSVHPHGRGEQTSARLIITNLVRFIPTGVGNSLVAIKIVRFMTVHPHGRGEQLIR